MSKLTWADVAHYYGQNNPRPDVVISNGRYFSNHATGYFCERECIDDGDRPVLTDLWEITEEDARIVFGLIMGRDWDFEQDGQGIEELFVTQGPGWIPSHANNLAMYPAAIHYLISRNYNVFGIETWKEVQP